MSDELRGEQWQKHLATKQNHRQARRSSFDAGWDAREAEIVGRVSDVERGLANASARVLELSQQVAEAKAEAWDEGERHESEYLATWGQFCPNPENPYRVVSRG